MTHDPALEAHEHAEHAEHAAHEHDPFISRVSITIAVLAVLAAAVGSLETIEAGGAITASSEAVLSQDKAKEQVAKQAEVKKQALEDEAERDKLLAQSRGHEHRHHWLTAAATLLEIGIAICTVAIITRRKAFWLGSLGLGLTGLALFGAAYLL
jgi:hypothetical protein